MGLLSILIGACEKAPEEVPVSSVTIGQETAEMLIGETVQLTATVLPSNATDKTVTWASSKLSVATVSSSGLVTAVSEGNSTVTASAGGKSTTCLITVSSGFVSVASISLDKENITLEEEGSTTLVATVKPDDATDKTVVWSSSNTSIATVDQSGKVTAVKEGFTTITAKAGEQSATCQVTVKKPVPAGAVDLGLSVYWGTCNLGATAPEEYGDYYAWGETETKENYDWLTYKWWNGSYDTITKYNNSSSYGTVDNKTVLDLEDDVAHVKLGGGWRMPSDAEWEELRTKCSWTWTTQNGTNGYKVTSKTNGNSIFLPIAGNRYLTDLSNVGSIGIYWSSSLYTDSPNYAWSVTFFPDSDYVFRSSNPRCLRQSVRPVSE